jgi:hypothetical protein
MVDFDREFFDKRFKSDKMIFAADELCLHHFGGPENATEPRPSNLDLRTGQRLSSVICLGNRQCAQRTPRAEKFPHCGVLRD